MHTFFRLSHLPQRLTSSNCLCVGGLCTEGPVWFICRLLIAPWDRPFPRDNTSRHNGRAGQCLWVVGRGLSHGSLLMPRSGNKERFVHLFNVRIHCRWAHFTCRGRGGGNQVNTERASCQSVHA